MIVSPEAFLFAMIVGPEVSLFASPRHPVCKPLHLLSHNLDTIFDHTIVVEFPLHLTSVREMRSV